MNTSMPTRTQVIASVALLAVILLAAIVYWAGLNGPFVLDDPQNILSVYVADFDWGEILYTITHNNSGVLSRPVAVLSLVFSGIVHGPGSWGYKYHNLAIHLINGLLVFWLLLKILPRLGDKLTEGRALLIAGVTAAIWLLHPLLVSTVLYAVQRMAQLSTLFTLVALLVYLFAREASTGSARRFYLLAYLVFPLVSILAVLSKETGVLIPLYVILMEMCLFRFDILESDNRRLQTFLALATVVPITAVIIYMGTHMDSLTDYEGRTFTMGERLLTQLHVVFFYLKLILLPRLADMGLYHDDFGVVRQFDVLTLVFAVLLGLALFLMIRLRRRAPVIAFAIGWFLVSHLLESTFISLEMVFEHRNYIAALGPLLAVNYYLLTCTKYPNVAWLVPVIGVLLLFLTVMRVQEWKSPGMFFEIAIQEHPDSYRANTEYANLNFNAGKLDEALVYLRRAQDLNTLDYGAVLHEVAYSCSRGEDLAPLFDKATQRAALSPVTPYALNSMDNLLRFYQIGICPDLDLDVVLNLVHVAKQQQGNIENREYFGYLQREEGQINLLQGNYPEAVTLLMDAYNNSGQVMILLQLADIQLKLNRLQDARQLIDYLVQINEDKFGIESPKLDPLVQELEKREQEQGLSRVVIEQ